MRCEDISKHLASSMVNRRPEPTLLLLGAHKAPPERPFQLHRLSPPSPVLGHAQFVPTGVDSPVQDSALFFNSSITVVGLILSTRAVSLIPLPLTAMSLIFCLTSGK